MYKHSEMISELGYVSSYAYVACVIADAAHVYAVDSDIGVISPYNAQNGKIRKAINTPALKKSRPGVLKVGSVEEFQGQVCGIQALSGLVYLLTSVLMDRNAA